VKTHLLTAKVVPAESSLPTIPRWYANKMPLASGVAAEVGRMRTALAANLDPRFLMEEYGLTRGNADALVAHFTLQAEVSRIPTQDFLLVEVYREPGLLHYFFHSLIGRAANDALSRIIAERIKDARGGNALTTIDDYGFLLTLRSFKWQFRGTSQTGLMVPRRVHGAERGARSLQFSSEIIFDVLLRHEPDHPLLEEAYSEVILRFLDLPRAISFMEKAAGMPWDLREVSRVSPFSFGIYVSKIKETMTLEDPETTIERLYHEMYGRDQARLHADPA
jgi:ATP-dependent Lhr-like helicase